MDREKLIALLGLNASATDAEIEAALAGHKTAAPNSNIDISQFVPRADYEQLRSTNAQLKLEQEARDKKLFEDEVDAAINAAIKDGKIPPVSKDFHRASCLTSRANLDKFVEYVKLAPEIANNKQMEEAEKNADKTQHDKATSDLERQVCKFLGLKPDELEATRNRMRENDETYHPHAYRFALGVAS
jgi:phage I-like protein